MALFACYSKDGPDGASRRDAHRDRHVAYVRAADEAGRIVFAGPLKNREGGSIGAIILFEAEDEAAAQRWVDGDPYVVGGVYASVELHAVRRVFPSS